MNNVFKDEDFYDEKFEEHRVSAEEDEKITELKRIREELGEDPEQEEGEQDQEKPIEDATSYTAKWVFKYYDLASGEERWSAPAELSDLVEASARLNLAGTFCLCVIIPDFESKVRVEVDVKGSKFLEGKIPRFNLEKLKKEARESVGKNNQVSSRRGGRSSKAKA